MNPQRTLRTFEADLRAMGTTKRAQGEKAYLKSDLDFFGVDVPTLRKHARQFHREHPELARADLRAIVRAQWNTRWHEQRSLGIGLLAEYRPQLQAQDMSLVEELLRNANTWAHVDWLACTVAGDLVRRFATARRRLDRWNRDDVMWLRRSSLLALLEDLRAGEGDFERFERLAIPLLPEKEFFIRKAIGWVLREVSKKRPELTHAFLVRHLPQVSGLTLREGSRRLPAALQQDLRDRR